jgi:ribosome-associated translation inhibitor RaiA
MKIQVNSDKNIRTDVRLTEYVEEEARRSLTKYERRLTRVEFHLSDVNSHKFGPQDKRCRIEARPARRQPVGVTMTAGSVRSAIQGALAKLENALEKYFGRTSRETQARRTKKSAPPLKRAAAGRPPAEF